VRTDRAAGTKSDPCAGSVHRTESTDQPMTEPPMTAQQGDDMGGKGARHSGTCDSYPGLRRIPQFPCSPVNERGVEDHGECADGASKRACGPSRTCGLAR